MIEAVGDGVTHVAPGDRAADVGGPPGGYASTRNVPAARVVKLPEGVSTELAASLIFKGLTVEYLIRRCHAVQPGDAVLLHAAAGGIGQIASQWLKQIGATVIGTVGSEEKAEQARTHGCEHTIIYTKENFVERVREITEGKGVSVVYGLDRQGYVLRLARLPPAPRAAGQLRHVFRSRSAVRPGSASAPRDRCSSPGHRLRTTPPGVRSLKPVRSPCST